MKKIILLIMMSIYMFGSNGSVVLYEHNKTGVFTGFGGGLVWTFIKMKSNYNKKLHTKYLRMIDKQQASHSLNILLFNDKVLLVNTNKGIEIIDKLLPLDNAVVGGMIYLFDTNRKNKKISLKATLQYREQLHRVLCEKDFMKSIISKNYIIVFVSVLRNKVIISVTDSCENEK